MLSQHALLSIISILGLLGSSYQVQRGMRRAGGREGGEEGGRQSGHWLHCQQQSEQAKSAVGSWSSWRHIRALSVTSTHTITPSRTRVTQPGPPRRTEPKILFHLSAPNICTHLISTFLCLLQVEQQSPWCICVFTRCGFLCLVKGYKGIYEASVCTAVSSYA